MFVFVFDVTYVITEIRFIHNTVTVKHHTVGVNYGVLVGVALMFNFKF